MRKWERVLSWRGDEKKEIRKRMSFFFVFFPSFARLFLRRNLLLSSSSRNLSSTNFLCSKLEIDLDLVLWFQKDLDLDPELPRELDLALLIGKLPFEDGSRSCSTFCKIRLLGLSLVLCGVFKSPLSCRYPVFHNVNNSIKTKHKLPKSWSIYKTLDLT